MGHQESTDCRQGNFCKKLRKSSSGLTKQELKLLNIQMNIQNDDSSMGEQNKINKKEKEIGVP